MLYSKYLLNELADYLAANKDIAAMANKPIPDGNPEKTALDDASAAQSGFLGMNTEFWKNAIKSGLNGIIKKDPYSMVNFGIDSLLGWIFAGEKKDDPTLGILTDISNKLDQISNQLNTIIGKLEQIFSAITAQNYRSDIAYAATVRDPLQQEVNLINARLAHAGGNENLRREIIKSINTTTVSGNSFYQQTMAMGDTIIRTMNHSQQNLFFIAAAFAVSHGFYWDHQENMMYTNITSYYMGTYMQAVGYSKLAILYQLESNKNDPVVYNNYLSLFDILFCGDVKLGITSSAQRVENAFDAAPHNTILIEHAYYACYKKGSGAYVLRNTTVFLDSAINRMKPVSKADIERIVLPDYSSNKRMEAAAFVLGHFELFAKLNFQIRNTSFMNSEWLIIVMQLLDKIKKLGLSNDVFFKEMAGLVISPCCAKKDFKKIGMYGVLDYSPASCIVRFRALLPQKTEDTGSITLLSNTKNPGYFDSYAVSGDLSPIIFATITAPSA